MQMKDIQCYEHVHLLVYLFKEVGFFMINLKQLFLIPKFHTLFYQSFLKADIKKTKQNLKSDSFQMMGKRKKE